MGNLVFVSYNRQDQQLVEQLVVRLKDPEEGGFNVWRDSERLTPGAPWRDEIEDALRSSSAVVIAWGPHGLGPIQRQERDLAYALRDENDGLKVVYVVLPKTKPPGAGWARIDTWVDFDEDIGASEPFERLVSALRGQAPPSVVLALPDEPVPYPGMAAFEVEDQTFFFGRSEYVETLGQKLDYYPFLAIVGPSGSGKTSLVQAGFVPSLGLEHQPIIVQPGPRPIQALARAISATVAELDSDSLADELTRDPEVLPDRLTQTVAEGPALLVIDRLEELFTLCQDDGQKDAFVKALLAVAHHPHRRNRVIVTMRADFYAHLTRHPRLAAEISDHQVYVNPASEAEIAEIIEQPAVQVGAIFEVGLSAQLLRDSLAAGEISLPLLQLALNLLWHKRQGRWLTWKAYEEMGRIQGALRYHADGVIKNLGRVEKETVRRLLVGLVWIEEDEGYRIAGRRRSKQALLEDVRSAGKGGEVLLQGLADARLITLRGVEGDEPTVELIHDTLPLHWKALHSWVKENQEFLLWRQRLRPYERAWRESGRKDRSALLGGVRLEAALRQLRARGRDLNNDERAFIKASRRSRSRRRFLQRLVVVPASIAALLLVGWWLWAQTDSYQVFRVLNQGPYPRIQQREVSERFVSALGLLGRTEIAYEMEEPWEWWSEWTGPEFPDEIFSFFYRYHLKRERDFTLHNISDSLLESLVAGGFIHEARRLAAADPCKLGVVAGAATRLDRPEAEALISNATARLIQRTEKVAGEDKPPYRYDCDHPEEQLILLSVWAGDREGAANWFIGLGDKHKWGAEPSYRLPILKLGTMVDGYLNRGWIADLADLTHILVASYGYRDESDSSLFQRIAIEFYRIGRSEEADRLINAIVDHGYISGRGLVATLGRAGNIESVENGLRNRLRQLIERSYDRFEQTPWVASLFLTAGEPSVAREVIEGTSAVLPSDSETELWVRSWLLAGDIERARQHQDHQNWDSFVVKAMLDQLAHSRVPEAIELGELFDLSEDKRVRGLDRLFGELTTAWIEAGELKQAELASMTVQDTWIRRRSLLKVAFAYLAAGKLDEVRRLADLAGTDRQNSSEKLVMVLRNNFEYLVEARLIEMLPDLLEFGLMEPFLALVEEESLAAGELEGSQIKRAVAVAYAAHGNLLAAREWAERCDRTQDKRLAYSAILAEYAKNKNPSLSRDLAHLGMNFLTPPAEESNRRE